MNVQDLSDSDSSGQDDWLIDDEAEVSPASVGPDERPMRILIVDDEVDVHSVTRLALRNVTFKGRPLELMSAYSGAEAFQVLSKNTDIALILLDVVMETDDAGLRLVGRIRQELDNQLVRIVLRTGQPGQAPEQQVIIDYDINDYKAKTELTTQKLFTTVVASLRAYESLLLIQRSRAGLTKILEGATNLYQIRSLREFASGALNQISAILDVGADGVLCVSQTGTRMGEQRQPSIVATTGGYSSLDECEFLPPDHVLSKTIAKAFLEKRSQFEHPVDVLFIQCQQGHEFAISITPPWPLTNLQRELLEVFCARIAAAFDNLYLFGQLRKAQEATVVALADLAEFRDEGTGGHVRRVQKLTNAIALKLQERGVYQEELTQQLCEMIGLASILHDVGKVSTPDHVLLKPGIHTPEERVIMREHAQVGESILERASNMIDGTSYLTFGAQIAGGHHEHYDGGGYPRGRKGTEIPLAARIVAVVDVFDALLHRRPYKEAWPFDEMITYIRERRGTQFDPEVVDALMHIVETSDALEWMSEED
jgi:response regulator RpfG family c-di-GMP phosphodiesterase